MFEFLTEALKALSGYPQIEMGLIFIVILFGGRLFFQGERDNRRTNGAAQSIGTQSLPSWTVYGPAHDAMGEISGISEQGRKQTELLSKIVEHLSNIAENGRRQVEEQHRTTAVLELIRNESRLR